MDNSFIIKKEHEISELKRQIYKFKEEIEKCRNDIKKIELIINKIESVNNVTNETINSIFSKINKLKSHEQSNFSRFYEESINGIIKSNGIFDTLDSCSSQKNKLNRRITELYEEIKKYENMINCNNARIRQIRLSINTYLQEENNE